MTPRTLAPDDDGADTDGADGASLRSTVMAEMTFTRVTAGAETTRSPSAVVARAWLLNGSWLALVDTTSARSVVCQAPKPRSPTSKVTVLPETVAPAGAGDAAASPAGSSSTTFTPWAGGADG